MGSPIDLTQRQSTSICPSDEDDDFFVVKSKCSSQGQDNLKKAPEHEPQVAAFACSKKRKRMEEEQAAGACAGASDLHAGSQVKRVFMLVQHKDATGKHKCYPLKRITNEVFETAESVHVSLKNVSSGTILPFNIHAPTLVFEKLGKMYPRYMRDNLEFMSDNKKWLKDCVCDESDDEE